MLQENPSVDTTYKLKNITQTEINTLHSFADYILMPKSTIDVILNNETETLQCLHCIWVTILQHRKQNIYNIHKCIAQSTNPYQST